jgi:hypothetical protein
MRILFNKRDIMANKEITSLLTDQKKEKLTKEDMTFIFNQAEKMLKDSIDTSTLIVNRTNTILTIVSTTLIAISGFLISQFLKNNVEDKAIVMGTTGFIYMMVLAFYCAMNIKPHRYITNGTMPTDLLNDAFFADNIKNEDRILRFYFSEIENYEFRTKRNNKLNTVRWETYRNSLWALFIFPVAMILCYFLITILW